MYYAIGIIFYNFFAKKVCTLQMESKAWGKKQKKILEASKHHMIILDSKLYVEIWIEVDFPYKYLKCKVMTITYKIQVSKFELWHATLYIHAHNCCKSQYKHKTHLKKTPYLMDFILQLEIHIKHKTMTSKVKPNSWGTLSLGSWY